MQWNLADLFEAVAASVAGREALVCPAAGDDPEVRLTYRQLDERATRLAHVLADRGVGRDDAVALLLRNGNEYLEASLACFKLRAFPVNVNHRAVTGEVAALLADSAAKVVLHEPDLAEVVRRAGPGLPTLARGPAWEAAVAAAPGTPLGGPRSGDDRYVLYTGGTTGRPKGVVWRHVDLFFAALGGGDPGRAPLTDPRDLVGRARAGRSRCLAATPFMHGTGHWIALTTLLGGGTVVTLRSTRLDADELLDVAERESVRLLIIIGDAFGRPLVEALERRGDREGLTSVNVVLSGGAGLSAATKADLVRLLPWAMVVDGYGASETGGQGQRVSYPGAPTAGEVRPRFAVGGDTAVLGDDLRPLPPGDARVGWLARRGHIPLGYLNDPEGTARAFPVVDGVRWAVPGDRASVAADGTIELYGRGSATISTGGETVQAEEVEDTVRSHPAVRDAVVVGIPDERWGEVVTAVVSLRPGRVLTLDELAEHCRGHLAGYKLPRRLVVVDEVERSPSGKADVRWARAVGG